MIRRIVVLALPAGDDAARAAILAPRRFDRVFAVIAAWLDGQAFLEVVEDDAIAVIRERAAALDQGERFAGLGGQVGGGNPIAFGWAAQEGKSASERQQQDDQEALPIAHGVWGRAL